MGAGSGKGGGGAGGVPPVLPNQPTSGKGGSNGIPPAQPNQPTLGNQLNPQPPAMGKGGAMSLDYDRRPPPAFAQQSQLPDYAKPFYEGLLQPQQPAMSGLQADPRIPQSQGGKGGAQPQPMRNEAAYLSRIFGPQDYSRERYDRMMSAPNRINEGTPMDYEQWRDTNLSMNQRERDEYNASMGKGGAEVQQPIQPQQPTMGKGGGKGSAQQIAQQIPPQIAQQLVQAIQGGKGGAAQPQQPMQPPPAPVSQGITGLPNIPRGSARPRNRRLMSPAPRRSFSPLTRRGETR